LHLWEQGAAYNGYRGVLLTENTSGKGGDESIYMYDSISTIAGDDFYLSLS